MDYCGICAGSCGEIVQGQTGEGEFLTSYSIPLYSKAVIRYNKKSIFPWKLYPKATQALRKMLAHFGEEDKLSHMELHIAGNIPRGKGMSSSTADIGAVIGACCSLLSIKVDPVFATQIAASIEPTDSIFFDQLTMVDPLSGCFIQTVGNIKNCKVLILEPPQKVDTLSIRKRKDYKIIKDKNKPSYRSLLCRMNKNGENIELNRLGSLATESALLNEELLPKSKLIEILEITKKLGGIGINIAHSGSVVGILLNEDDNTKAYIQSFVKESISRYYGRMYCLPIIEGGIKNWREK